MDKVHSGNNLQRRLICSELCRSCHTYGRQLTMKPSEVTPFRTAIVHDWLYSYAGSERVLEQMLSVLPEADLYAVADFLQGDNREFLRGRQVTTTFIQRLPFARKKYRSYLPLMPLAIESLDLSGYDLVVSSSHAVAKGVITGPDQLHLCMCYSPMRYAWDLQHRYLAESGLASGARSWVARAMLHRMRNWDARTGLGVDEFIAISRFIARRIEKTYRRTSTVIYPPVDTDYFRPSGDREDFYLAASRLVPYKHISIIVEAFAEMPERRLLVVGSGPEFERIRALATPNVSVLGHQPSEALRSLMQSARAFVFAAEEDFGIVALEAQACGTPVIAYGKGGSLETVQGWWPHEGGCPPRGATGVFFAHQSADSLRSAVGAFEAAEEHFSRDACRAFAEGFGIERFRDEFHSFVQERWHSFQEGC